MTLALLTNSERARGCPLLKLSSDENKYVLGRTEDVRIVR